MLRPKIYGDSPFFNREYSEKMILRLLREVKADELEVFEKPTSRFTAYIIDDHEHYDYISVWKSELSSRYFCTFRLTQESPIIHIWSHEKGFLQKPSWLEELEKACHYQWITQRGFYVPETIYSKDDR